MPTGRLARANVERDDARSAVRPGIGLGIGW